MADINEEDLDNGVKPSKECLAAAAKSHRENANG